MRQIILIAVLLSIPHFIKGSPNWVEPDGSSLDATQLIIRKQILEAEKKTAHREPASDIKKKTSSAVCEKTTDKDGTKSSCEEPKNNPSDTK